MPNPRMRLSAVVNSMLGGVGLELRRVSKPVTIKYYTERFDKIFERVHAYSLTSSERVLALCDAVTFVTRNKIAGDFVECGVWRGGSSMAAAMAFMDAGDGYREMHLFDTFEGMPARTEHDVELANVAFTPDKEGDLAVSLEKVRANMASTGYDMTRVHFHPGPVNRTLPDAAPKHIAILRLDTDWYESTKHELHTLWPRVVPGGFMIIDDYGHWAGAKKAVDEYFGEDTFMFRIDYTGRMLRKPL